MKKRGLGRGLDELLGENKKDNKLADITSLGINEIVPGKSQPRGTIEEKTILELSQSIKSQGLMQPIVVRENVEKKQFEIIAGERRWRACKLAGLDKIPVIIKKVNDKTALAMALVENLQRKDLNALEEARGISKLIKDYNLTHEQAANALGKSRTSISNLLRLLTSPGPIKKMLEENLIEQGHVRAMLVLDTASQLRLANQCVLKKLSVRQVENLVNEISKRLDSSKNEKKLKNYDMDIVNLENTISNHLNLTAKLNIKSKTTGEIKIKYNSLNELESFLKKIKIK